MLSYGGVKFLGASIEVFLVWYLCISKLPCLTSSSWHPACAPFLPRVCFFLWPSRAHWVRQFQSFPPAAALSAGGEPVFPPSRCHRLGSVRRTLNLCGPKDGSKRISRTKCVRKPCTLQSRAYGRRLKHFQSREDIRSGNCFPQTPAHSEEPVLGHSPSVFVGGWKDNKQRWMLDVFNL